jgi:glyoxylase I family protein
MTSTQPSGASTAEAPAIVGLAHVELSVTDLERSVDWYCNLLGATALGRLTSEEYNFVACAIWEPRSKTMLAFTQHNEREDDRFTPRRPGLDHLSFRVADRAALEAWQERLEGLGIPHDPIKDEGYQEAITFRDPDGIALEVQYGKRSV